MIRNHQISSLCMFLFNSNILIHINAFKYWFLIMASIRVSIINNNKKYIWNGCLLISAKTSYTFEELFRNTLNHLRTHFKIIKGIHEDNIKSIEVFVPKMASFVSPLHELYFEIYTCWEINVWFSWIFAWFWNTLNWPLLRSLSRNENSNWAMWAY